VNRSSLTRLAIALAALGFIALLSLNIGGIFAQSQKPVATDGKTAAGNVENGRKAFTRHGCFSCHGYSGEGGRGARLAQSLPPFEAFAQYVRRPQRTMPPFGNQVSDQELADMYAFIKTVQPSPDLKSIPLLTNP
jgi:mono/diheme cytochrome c family protein